MTGDPPVWLFVAYGGGHIRMVLPVARRARELGLARPVILALTSAAAPAREAGFSPLGFADFLRPGDEPALAIGRTLLASLPTAPLDLRESEAYLSLSYVDLQKRYGKTEAARRYAMAGRQCFEPVGILERIIGDVAPAVVIATNSPRAERAAILAAGRLGIPSVCLVDLFAIDEVAWIGQQGYGSRVCVLDEAVRTHLVAAGRQPAEVIVTGNPAFDSVRSPDTVRRGRQLRREQAWENAKVVVWASQPEPALHPSVPGKVGNPGLPDEIERELVKWAAAASDRVLVIRRHPSEHAPLGQAAQPGVLQDGRQFELHPLLYAADAVVTMSSTVGVEAFLAGRPVVQVLGSLFDESVPLARHAMATACADSSLLSPILDGCLAAASTGRLGLESTSQDAATQAVLAVIKEL